MNPKLLKDWTKEELQEMCKQSHQYNGDPEEYSPDNLSIAKMDHCWVYYLKMKLITEIGLEILIRGSE